MNVIERFSAFYQCINEDSLSKLSELYATDVVFVDPVKQHKGLIELTGYFSNLMVNTSECRCEIHDIVSSENNHLVIWSMLLRHPKLDAGRKITVEGVTQLKTRDEFITFHRDYYDLGQMIYEHIPILKHVVRNVKKRLVS